MTVLTKKEIRKEFGATKSEIDKYFKNHPKLKKDARTIKRVRRKILASKIAHAPGKEVTIRQSAAEWQVIYGRTRVGGIITFIHSTTEALHLVITVAGSEITTIDHLYFDNEEVIFGASPDPRWSTGIRRKDGTIADATNKIFMSINYGSEGEAANADLIGQLPDKWTSAHQQSGCAHVYLILKWDATLFPSDIPEITFDIAGKPCMELIPAGTAMGVLGLTYAEPVEGSRTFTTNAVSILADYMMDTRYGLGVPFEEMHTPSWYEAWADADEDVDVQAGGTEKRYTIDGSFKTSDSPQEVIERMCAAFGGSIARINGKWKIFAAKWREPVLDLTEDDIINDIRIQTKYPRKDSFNAVRGTFISPADNFDETDFPIVKNSFYQHQDNDEQVFEDLQLLFTNSPSKCQRLAKIELERNRQSITVQLLCKLRAFQLEPPDTVTLTLDRMGWSEKPFEVESLRLVMHTESGSSTPALAVELLLKETAEAVYDWNDGEETTYDLAPNSDLPNPMSVPTIFIENLESGTDQLDIRADGTVFSRIKVTWSEPNDFFVTSGGEFQVEYKKSTEDEDQWRRISAVDGQTTHAYILDVADYTVENPITYDVRVRARTGAGGYSGYASYYGYAVIGKTAPPSDVQGFQGSVNDFGIRLFWDKVPDRDVKDKYEIRVGASDSTWDSATSLIEVVTGTSKTIDIVQANQYRFFIKAVDTSGNYSTNASLLNVTVSGPAAPEVDLALVGLNIVVRWSKPISRFAIDYYEISYSDPDEAFEDRVFITNSKGNSYQERIIGWSGTRTFWVVAVDVAGNVGTPAAENVTIAGPGAVDGLTPQVIDNNVLLRWSAPTTGTLPIDHYNVYKGDDYDDALLIGETRGTFSALFEILGGTYTYWVTAVDSAGNIGTPTPVSAIVSQPPDFVLLDDQLIDLSTGTGTGWSYQTSDGSMLLPIDEGQTWEDHFLDNSATTFQDFIDDGFVYYIEPATDSATFEKVIDYGVVVGAALINVSYIVEEFAGDLDLHLYLAYSNDGMSWTEEETTQVYGTNFQYVRIKFTVEP